jgi:hypothetical protein
MKTGNDSIILCMLVDSSLAFGAGSRSSMPVSLYLLLVISVAIVVLGATILLQFPMLRTCVNLFRQVFTFEND